MMLLHHLFLKGRFENYPVIFSPFSASQIINIANYCKSCVSLFAFISGYGLYKSYKHKNTSAQKWVVNRYIKTFNGYWFIVILSWLICWPVNNRPFRVYGFEKSTLYGIWNMSMELIGITHLVQSDSPLSMLGTWWYMGACLAFILLSPFIFESLDQLGGLSIWAAVVLLPRVFGLYPGNDHFYSFLPAFLLGAILAKSAFFNWYSSWRLFDRFESDSPISHIGKVLMLLFACFTSYKLFYVLSRSDPGWLWWDFNYGIFVLFPILLCFEVFQIFPHLKRLIGFLGEHSANIYLTHNFIKVIFFTDFIYTRGHFITIILILLIISIGISVVINYLKKITGYICFIKRISFLVERMTF